MTLYHAYNQTVGDGTATSVVRPSDWNSGHNQFVTISGNTAGFSSVSGTNIVYQAGNNVTISAATAAGAATIVFSGANTVAQTVQTQASGAIAGTGFTSTSTAGTALTAALGTNGLTMAVPAFITTYANDLTSGRAGTGFTSASTAGVAITAALGTNGLSMAVPAFITTYVAQTTQTQAAGNLAGVGYTSTTQAGSTVGVTQGTNGLSAAWPPFITTAAAAQTTQTQAAGNIAGTGFTSASTAGVAITAALGTNGLSMAVPAFITTYAAQTTQTQAAGNIAGIGYTSTTQAGSTVGVTQNTAGFSAAWPPFLTTAAAAQTVQTQAAGNIAGTGFTSASTAGVAITAAMGTNGLNMGVPAFITTYVAQTTQTQAAGNIAGVGTTFGGTNISGSMTMNSNGLALSLSAASAGGAVATNNYYAAMTTGNTFVGSMGQNSLYVNYMDLPSNVQFCHADQLVSINIVATTSFNSTVTSNIITTVVSAATWAMTRSFGIYAQGTGTNSTRLELLPGSSTVSFGATLGYSLGLSQTASQTVLVGNYTGTQRVTNGFSFAAIASVDLTGGVTYTTLGFQATASKATASSSTSYNSANLTVSVANVSTSLFTGLRDFVAPMVSNLGPGNYWLAQAQSSASTTSGWNTAVMSISQVMNTTLNITNFQHLSETANNSTSNFMPYQGVYTVSTAGFPATIRSNHLANNTAFSNAGVPTVFMNDPFP